MEEKYQGAPLEVPQEEKGAKTLKEVVASSSMRQPVWKEKPASQRTMYPIFDQGQTDMCVAFTIAKLMGIAYLKDEGTFLDFSKRYLYEQRSNKPGAGMASADVFNLSKKGVTLESLYPTLTDRNNNTDNFEAKPHAIKVAEVFKIGDTLGLVAGDIDQVASTIEATGKGVMVWVWSTFPEWQRVNPQITSNTLTLYTASVRHSVTAVDYFLVNGKKCLLIEDSWGVNTGDAGRRILTEDFFKARNYYAGYITKFVFTETPVIEKPKNAVKFGDTSKDVNVLQKYLQSKGFFPANHGTTDYYGSITADAVLRWQLANDVDNPSSLRQLKGHHFGPKSLAKV